MSIIIVIIVIVASSCELRSGDVGRCPGCSLRALSFTASLTAGDKSFYRHVCAWKMWTFIVSWISFCDSWMECMHAATNKG